MSGYRPGLMADALDAPLSKSQLACFVAACRGSVEDAATLAGAIPASRIGLVIALARQAQMAPASFRALLSACWLRDHRQIVAAAICRRRLASWFKYAGFPPARAPARVRVWRGGAGSFRQVACGFDWHLNRGDAVQQAVEAGCGGDRAVLVSATVERSSIALRDGQRVVVLRAPLGVLAVQK